MRARLLFSSVLFASFVAAAHAQVQDWAVSFTGATVSNDAISDMALDPNGNVVVCGMAGNDFTTIKYSPSGGILWSRQVDGGSSSSDVALDVLVAPSGDVYVTGMLNIGGIDTPTLIHYRGSDGFQIFREDKTGTRGFGSKLALGTNQLYCIGSYFSTSTEMDGFLEAFNPTTGASIWFDPIATNDGASLADRPTDLYVDAATEDVYYVGIGGAVSPRSFYVRCTSGGAKVWQKQLGFSTEVFRMASQPGSSSFFVCGQSSIASDKDASLWKVNQADGSIAWQRNFNGKRSSNDRATGVNISLGDGSVRFIGERTDYGNQTDAFVMSCDTNGNLLWEHVYAGADGGDDRALDGITDGTSNTLFIGESTGSTRKDAFTCSVGVGGVRKWARTYDKSGYDDFVNKVVQDSNGAVYVGGRQFDPLSFEDFLLIRYVNGQIQFASPSIQGGTSTIATLVINPALTSSQTAQFSIGSEDVFIEGGSGNQREVGGNVIPFDKPGKIIATIGGAKIEGTFTIRGPRPDILSLNPTSVVGGGNVEANLQMIGEAPEGGVPVAVWDTSAFILTPAVVTYAAVDGFELFDIGTKPVNATAGRSVFAKLNGVTASADLVLLPGALTSLALNPTVVVGGSTTTGTVTLSGAAGIGGRSVPLSDNSSVITTPASVLVPAGSTIGSFTANTSTVTASATRQISATLAGVTKTANLTINPGVALSSLSLNPASVKGGNSTTGTVTMAGPAPNGGLTVTLTDNSSSINTPASVAVSQGATTGTFQSTTTAVTATATRQISATYQGVTKTANLTLTP